MSFAAVFAREFRLRRILLLGALVAGLAAVVLPRLQGQSGSLAADNAAYSALLLCWVTSTLFAVLLGAGAIARDLSDGRLAFDFSRPISASAIWGGRLGAALVLLVMTAALIMIPALLFGGRFESPLFIVQGLDISPASFAALAILFGTFLLFATHVGASLFASRSARLGLDLLGLLATGLLVGTALTRLDRHGVGAVFVGGGLVFAMFAVGVLVFASYVQISRGRTDLARGHRVLSVVLWSGLMLGAVALEATSRWAVSPELDDLTHISALVSAPRGDWFAVSGPVRGRGAYSGSFFANAKTGRSIRLPRGSREGWLPTTFSAEGSRAVWQAQEGSGRTSYAIWGLDLTREAARPEEVMPGLPFFSSLDLSPSGRWCAITLESRLLVFDVPIRRLVESIELPTGWSDLRTAWIGADDLRLFRRISSEPANAESALARIEIFEVDLPDGRVTKIAATEDAPFRNAWDVSADGSTLVLVEKGRPVRLLFDGATGERLGEITQPERSTSAFLSDATTVAFDTNRGRLTRWDRQGQNLANLEVSPREAWYIGGLAAPDLLLAASSVGPHAHGELNPRDWNLTAIDLRTGTATPLGSGLPAGWARRIEAGELGARLVDLGAGKLGVFDAETLRVEPLVITKDE